MRAFTERGFEVFAVFNDRYNNGVRIQESSLAEEPCVWIFCDAGPTHDAKIVPPSPHLTLDQARIVRDALDAFLKKNEEVSGG